MVGGLGVGEDIFDCVCCEFFEEVGVLVVLVVNLVGCGVVCIWWVELEGWYDEVLYVFDLLLFDDFVLVN